MKNYHNILFKRLRSLVHNFTPISFITYIANSARPIFLRLLSMKMIFLVGLTSRLVADVYLELFT